MSEPESAGRQTRARPITKKMKLAIAALARGETVADAAKAASVRSRSTINRWRTWPEFQQALEQHERDLSDAVSAIRRIVNSEDKAVAPLVKLKAAIALSDMLTASAPDRSGLVDR